MSLRVLVSGASIAGLTAAWWLSRWGHSVTVLERDRQFREGGQNIDVRGAGREVLRRMDLEKAALDNGTGEIGTAWVDEDGHIAAQVLTEELGHDGPTAEMEILRGDLARLIYESLGSDVEFRFGLTIVHADTANGKASVIFSSGHREDFDVAIVAEGVGSSTRDKLFPGENHPRWMDLTMAYFTIERTADDDRLWRWYNAPGGRSVSLRPDRHGTTRANLCLQHERSGEQDMSRQAQMAFMQETFADAGWQTPRVLEGMRNTDDFYFDVLRQVRMPRWSVGHVALTGDAAWCVTPLAGIGATLAIVGSYVLAHELHLRNSVPEALSTFEKKMRPAVSGAQNVKKLAPRLMHPRSQVGIGMLHRALAVATRPSIRGAASKAFAREPDWPDLDEYRVVGGSATRSAT